MQTTAAKIAEAQALLAAGNEFFRAGNLKAALNKYARIALYIDGLLAEGDQLAEYAKRSDGVMLQGQQAAEVKQLRLKSLLNMAQIDLLNRNFEKALTRLVKVQPLDPNNPKLLYRRAVACLEIGRLQQAAEDIARLGSEGGELSLRLGEARKREDARSKELMRRMLGQG